MAFVPVPGEADMPERSKRLDCSRLAEAMGACAAREPGYCPVCGAEVFWTPTAYLWPIKRTAHSVMPGRSGTCPQCHRLLMFTVVRDPKKDANSKTIRAQDDRRSSAGEED